MQAGEYFMEHRTEIYDKVGQFIMEALKAIVAAVPYIVEGIAYLVGSLVEYIFTHIPDMAAAAGQIMLAFLQSVVDIAGPLMRAMEDALNSMLNAIGDFFNDMFNAGVNLIQGFINGILSAPGAIADAIGSAVGGAINEGKRLLGIASPSRVFAQIGEYSMLGLAQGITSTAGKVSDAADAAISGMFSTSAIAVNSTVRNAAFTAGNDRAAIGGVILNIQVSSREGEDAYDLGRRIGQATAYELRMQGVSA
jgi:phage-related protein